MRRSLEPKCCGTLSTKAWLLRTGVNPNFWGVNRGALRIREGFGVIFIRRSPQSSIGKYVGPYSIGPGFLIQVPTLDLRSEGSLRPTLSGSTEAQAPSEARTGASNT